MKKVMKSKVAAQKWLWWSDNGKIFITTIQVNLCCLLQLGIVTVYWVTWLWLNCIMVGDLALAELYSG